jgi:hypothetical protein
MPRNQKRGHALAFRRIRAEVRRRQRRDAGPNYESLSGGPSGAVARHVDCESGDAISACRVVKFTLGWVSSSLPIPQDALLTGGE